jgi:hypothetical protein
VNCPIIREQIFEINKRVFGRGPLGGVGFLRFEDPELSTSGFESKKRLGAEKAESADFLATNDALEQERRGRSLDLPEGRDRREAVAGQLAVNRDARGLSEPPGEVLERRSVDGHEGEP